MASSDGIVVTVTVVSVLIVISLIIAGLIFISKDQDRDYVRGGSNEALAPKKFGDSEKRTEREEDNPLLIAHSESKS
jgi:uncharacterized membrane protein